MEIKDKSIYIEGEIFIHAAPEKVWRVLTDPEMTKQYMYGCEIVSDWNIGDPLLWQGAQDGVTYVSGYLLEYVENEIFSFSVFDPNATYEDIPENYLVGRYTLTRKNEGTHLKVTQGDYASVADGEKRYQDTMNAGAWAPILAGIQKLAESLSE